MTTSESSKSVVRGLHSEPRGDDSLDSLRHNQTHTLPPGVRIGWLSEPLPELPEEHLRATDETTREALSAPTDAPDENSKLNWAMHRYRRVLVASVLLICGALLAAILLTRRATPTSPSIVNPPVELAASIRPPTHEAPPPAASVTNPPAPVPIAPPGNATRPKPQKPAVPSKTAPTPLPKKQPAGDENARVDELLFKSR